MSYVFAFFLLTCTLLLIWLLATIGIIICSIKPIDNPQTDMFDR